MPNEINLKGVEDSKIDKEIELIKKQIANLTDMLNQLLVKLGIE